MKIPLASKLTNALSWKNFATMTAALVLGIAVSVIAATVYHGGLGTTTAGRTVTPQAQASGAASAAPAASNEADDAAGWQTLARSYLKSLQFREAADAYAKAATLAPGDPQVLADYAYALAMANGRKLDGKPMELLLAALKIDPNHGRSLALAGQGAFNQGDYAGAIGYWQRLLKTFPAGSDAARVVAARISHAQMAQMTASVTTGGDEAER